MDIFSQRALRLFRVIFHQSFSGNNPSFNKRFPRQELAGLPTQDMGGVDINVWLATIRENSKMLIEVWTRTGQLEPIIMAWVLTKHPAGFVEASCIWWVKCRCWGLSRGKYLRFQSSKKRQTALYLLHLSSSTCYHVLISLSVQYEERRPYNVALLRDLSLTCVLSVFNSAGGYDTVSEWHLYDVTWAYYHVSNESLTALSCMTRMRHTNKVRVGTLATF